MQPVKIAIEALEKAGISYDLFDSVQVEPTDTSFKKCIEFARKLNPDAFLGMKQLTINNIKSLENTTKNMFFIVIADIVIFNKMKHRFPLLLGVAYIFRFKK